MKNLFMTTCALLIVLCCSSAFVQAEQKALWPGDDDFVITYYPGAIVDNPAVKKISKTGEWKEFLKKAFKRIDKECRDTIKNSPTASKLDSWVREQVATCLENDLVTVGDVFNEGSSHVYAFAFCLNLDTTRKCGHDRVSGTVIAIVDTDPEDSDGFKTFFKDKIDYQVVTNKDGIVILKITLAKGIVYAGKTRIGKTNQCAVVISRDEAEATARTKLLAKADSLAKMVDSNKTILKSVTVNRKLIKKITPGLGKIVAKGKELKDSKVAKKDGPSVTASFLPGMNPVATLRNICEKIDSLVYTVEQKGATGMVFGLQINTVTAEDANDLNDIVVGAIALFKVQTKNNVSDDKMDKKIKEAGEKVTEALRLVKFTKSDKTVFASVELSNESVTRCAKSWLKRAAKKLASQAL